MSAIGISTENRTQLTPVGTEAAEEAGTEAAGWLKTGTDADAAGADAAGADAAGADAAGALETGAPEAAGALNTGAPLETGAAPLGAAPLGAAPLAAGAEPDAAGAEATAEPDGEPPLDAEPPTVTLVVPEPEKASTARTWKLKSEPKPNADHAAKWLAMVTVPILSGLDGAH